MRVLIFGRQEIRSSKSETNGNDQISKFQTSKVRRLDNRAGSAFLLLFASREKEQKGRAISKDAPLRLRIDVWIIAVWNLRFVSDFEFLPQQQRQVQMLLD